MISLKRIGLSLNTRKKILAILLLRKTQASRSEWISNQIESIETDFQLMKDPEVDTVLKVLQENPKIDGLKLCYTFNCPGLTRKTLNLSSLLFDMGYRLLDISIPNCTKVGFFMPEVNYYFIKESGKIEQKMILTA